MYSNILLLLTICVLCAFASLLIIYIDSHSPKSTVLLTACPNQCTSSGYCLPIDRLVFFDQPEYGRDCIAQPFFLVFSSLLSVHAQRLCLFFFSLGSCGSKKIAIYKACVDCVLSSVWSAFFVLFVALGSNSCLQLYFFFSLCFCFTFLAFRSLLRSPVCPPLTFCCSSSPLLFYSIVYATSFCQVSSPESSPSLIPQAA